MHPDGKIRKEAFSSELRSWYPIQNAEKLETIVFEAFDVNNDGYIDFNEFMVVFYIMTNGTPEEKTRQVFRLCDRDKNGTVSHREIRYLLSFKPELADKLMTVKKKLLHLQ